MKISVLMSVYYKEKPEYLKEALESILNQTLKPSQIVIIKDGKLTKELDETLEKYKNKFPNLIDIYSLEANQGLGLALRYGVEKCKYEYIARMDTDDIAPLYRLEKQAKILENNPNLDCLGGYVEEYDEEMKKITSNRKVPLTQEAIKNYMKTQCPFNHGTVIMKKSAIIKSGNYDNTGLEDYDLWARMSINGCNMANTNLVLCKMRTGNAMYKRRSGINRIRKNIEIERKLLSYKIINRYEFVRNIIIRSIVCIFPVKMKKIIYTKFIRKVSIK